MEEVNPVDIRRREFELLRQEVADMKAQLTLDEGSDENKIILVRQVARLMGLSGVQISV